jgi:hypothetical protein
MPSTRQPRRRLRSRTGERASPIDTETVASAAEQRRLPGSPNSYETFSEDFCCVSRSLYFFPETETKT